MGGAICLFAHSICWAISDSESVLSVIIRDEHPVLWNSSQRQTVSKWWKVPRQKGSLKTAREGPWEGLLGKGGLQQRERSTVLVGRCLWHGAPKCATGRCPHGGYRKGCSRLQVPESGHLLSRQGERDAWLRLVQGRSG